MPFPDIVPELTDDLVRLRAHRADDLDRIVEQSHDPESLRYTTVPRPYGRAEARGFLDLIEDGWNDPRGRRYWAVTAADDPTGRYLGTIDLRPDATGQVAETGFGLHPDGRGRHLMAAALRLTARHFFDGGGRRVYWWANRGNFASWAVARACGFTFHGTLPDHLDHPDGRCDGWVASLVAQDPMTPRTPWLHAPVIEHDGIRLRPWRDDDGAAIEEPSQAAHLMPARSILRPDTFATWLQRRRESAALGSGVSWCIADARTDRALGEVLLFTVTGTMDGDHAELGYQVMPSARGRGVARTAARLVAAYALRPVAEGGLGLRRLVAVTAADNDASNAVLTGLGFAVWGREPATDVLEDGSVSDTLHWHLLPAADG